MRPSLLRVEDWTLPSNKFTNPQMDQIFSPIDQYQELIKMEKRQIEESIKDLTIRKTQLLKIFSTYRRSLKYTGEVKKEDIEILDSNKAKYFFLGYYTQIQEIVRKVGSNPLLFARMIAQSSLEKFNNPSFFQSILYHLYPCYLPSILKNYQSNNCLIFIQQVINQWNYDKKLGRPLTYNTILDQVLDGFIKNPEIVCYVEKISIMFFKELKKIKMDYYPFDQEDIKNELKFRIKTGKSQQKIPKSQGKSSWFGYIFGQKEEIQQKGSLNLQYNANQINNFMKKRQKKFFKVIKNTINTILKAQTPSILDQMFKLFHQKISREQSINDLNKQKRNSSSAKQHLPNGQKQQEIIQQSTLKIQSNKFLSNIQQNSRHYCYFLITNIICGDLLRKFTLLHKDKGIKPSNIRNITEIIRIITQIFKGVLPKDLINNQLFAYQFQSIIPKIKKFYKKIILRAECRRQTEFKSISYVENAFENKEIRQILLKLHQNTLILSFNDIKSIVAIIKSSSLINQLELSQKSKKLTFLNDQKIKLMFQPQIQKVQFHQTKHQVQKIFFIFNSSGPNVDQVLNFYIGTESPFKSFANQSKQYKQFPNIQTQQIMKLTETFELMKQLNIRQARSLLQNNIIKYIEQHFCQSTIISQSIREAIQSNLSQKILRKSILIAQLDQLRSRIIVAQNFIRFYTDQIRSSQFYNCESEAFISNIKIKVFLRIQNEEFKVYQNIDQIKGIRLVPLLMAEGQKQQQQQYTLRNSFKGFTKLQQLLNVLGRSSITRSALYSGKKIHQFNQIFEKICYITVQQIQQFLINRQFLKNLNKQKFAKIIVSNMQNIIHKKAQNLNILDKDITFNLVKKKINKNLFFKNDLENLKADWNFLLDEGKKKLQLMMEQNSINNRITHFEYLLETIFKIISFSMPAKKITSQVINPIIQYIILQSKVAKHYECLYSMQALKWNINPQTSYNMSTYELSLTYISDLMWKHYPLQQSDDN